MNEEIRNILMGNSFLEKEYVFPSLPVNKKFTIIIPYRDNSEQKRKQQLEILIPHLVSKLKSKNANFNIIVIEQNNYKEFNRGALLNVGADLARKSNSSYIILHDVDILPDDDLIDYYLTEPKTDEVWHIGKQITKYKYNTFFGAANSFSLKTFKKINGYPNSFWGWGGEDDCLLIRFTNLKNAKIIRPNKGMYKELQVEVIRQDPLREELKTKKIINDKKNWTNDGFNQISYEIFNIENLNSSTQKITVNLLLDKFKIDPPKEQDIFTEFAYNTEDAELNFKLALHYHGMNQTASAFSHYYRCAERTKDETLRYECLLRCYMCFMSQTNRDFTALHCLKQAVCLLPERPEAYFLIAKHYEDHKEFYDCYTYCNIALNLCNFNLPSLKTWVNYPGKYGLLFQKAISGWWWDKIDETYDILTGLLIDYPDLPDEYKTIIKNNLKNFYKEAKYRYTLPEEITQTKNVIDCFSFFSGYGKEMLELRYNILKDHVDYFVLCELNTTHTGTLIKQEAANLIEQLGLPKEKFIIINLNITEEENLEIQEIDRLNCMCGNHENKDSLYSRVRERLQKDAIQQIYDVFNDDTVFIHSDLDEIINPKYLKWFADQARRTPDNIIKVPLVYLQGRADLRTYFKDSNTPAPWDDNLFLCLKSHLQNASPTQIRSNKFTPYSNVYITQNNEIVRDAGWHFSWMGNSDIKKIKQKSFIHYTDKFDFVAGGSYNNTELNNILNVEDLENKIPPSGEKDKILKKYNINLLPNEIFKLDRVKNFLLPNCKEVNFLENIQDVLQNVYGFCSVKKATVLIDLITKNKLQTIVEIGVLEGSSLIPQALAVKQAGSGKVYGIDPWSQEESLQYTKDENHKNYWGTINHDVFYNNFLNHLQNYNIEGVVEVLKTTSKEASEKFLPNSIDMLHVDGNHSEEKSFEDVCLYLPLVRKGGFIVFDDLHWTDGGKHTTQKAAKYLQQHCTEIEQITDELGNFFVIFQK